MIRVLVADDHELVRQALRRVIEAIPDMGIVGEAAEGIEVLDLVSRTYADILLLDSGMPGSSVLFLLDEIKSRRASLPVLVLSVDPDERTAAELMRQGATGFLTKDHSPEELEAAIRRVTSGRRYLSPALAHALADIVHEDGAPPPHLALAPRELIVLVALARGTPVAKIARALGVSTQTVHAHRSRVLSKLGCANMVELVQYATRHALIATPSAGGAPAPEGGG